ncbi:MAG TPA: GTPase [Micromonospora sp.]|nr:GTPase [Micromonospora sp.]
MTDVADIREATPGDPPVEVDRMLARIEAVNQFLHAAEGHLPADRLVAARTVAERAATRLALSRDHTVVALAGATGSGKSSLFNALAYFEMSPVGVRRPTTDVTHACVWGPPEGAARLLDWIGVLPRYRFVRESALDGDDEAPLHGLVLLDLPDLDSVQDRHRWEVERLLGLVDMVVWVLDPQKYADRVVHANYLRRFRQHRASTVVALNQADLLAPAEVPRVVDDLRRLLEAGELDGVPVLATSALHQASMANLRVTLEHAVATRQAALRRLSTDLDATAEELSALMGPAIPTDDVDGEAEQKLVNALASAAGVPALVDAAESAYRQRAIATAGAPLARGLRWLRPAPLRAGPPVPSELPGGTAPAAPHRPGAAPPPGPATIQRPIVGLAVRTAADRVGASLPEGWRDAVGGASRSRIDDLPDALDRAVAAVEREPDHQPLWWRPVGLLQWLVTLGAAAGLMWLLVGYVLRSLGLAKLTYPVVGPLPVPALMLLGGVLLTLLIAAAVTPVVAAAARRVGQRTDARLRAAVAEVGRDLVIAPIHTVLRAYLRASEAVTSLRAR